MQPAIQFLLFYFCCHQDKPDPFTKSVVLGGSQHDHPQTKEDTCKVRIVQSERSHYVRQWRVWWRSIVSLLLVADKWTCLLLWLFLFSPAFSVFLLYSTFQLDEEICNLFSAAWILIFFFPRSPPTVRSMAATPRQCPGTKGKVCNQFLPSVDKDSWNVQ